MVVVKNTLLHKAFEASNVDFTPLYDTLKGSTAVFFCNTANVPAKLLKGYVKEGIPALKAAYAEESVYVGADKLEELASLKQKRGYCRDCCFAAVSIKECRFSSSIRRQYNTWRIKNFGRAS